METSAQNVQTPWDEGSQGSTDGYRFARGLSYAAILSTSQKVAWTVDEIFRERLCDASRPIVPASWVGSRHLTFLDAEEQLVLNHCRAFSYVHLLGNFEEFIPLHLGSVVEQGWDGDLSELRALRRFGEDEVKHQQLFRRAETVLEQSCGHCFGRYFDEDGVRVTELTRAILRHSLLPRAVILLALEWGTQRHYADSIRDHTAETGDALYLDVLRAHWVEEAQHTKSGALQIAHLTRDVCPERLRAAFGDIAHIGQLVDTTLIGQADEEIETLQRVVGRTFSAAEVATLRDTLHRSLHHIVVGVALTHPRFKRVALELSSEGAATLGIV